MLGLFDQFVFREQGPSRVAIGVDPFTPHQFPFIDRPGATPAAVLSRGIKLKVRNAGDADGHRGHAFTDRELRYRGRAPSVDKLVTSTKRLRPLKAERMKGHPREALSS
jgi:hypothetical protein